MFLLSDFSWNSHAALKFPRRFAITRYHYVFLYVSTTILYWKMSFLKLQDFCANMPCMLAVLHTSCIIFFLNINRILKEILVVCRTNLYIELYCFAYSGNNIDCQKLNNKLLLIALSDILQYPNWSQWFHKAHAFVPYFESSTGFEISGVKLLVKICCYSTHFFNKTPVYALKLKSYRSINAICCVTCHG